MINALKLGTTRSSKINAGDPVVATILTPSKSAHKPRNVPPFPVEFSDIERGIFNKIYESGYTMVGPERFYHSLLGCKYVIEHDIPGDWLECGVWRGGMSIAAKLMFEAYGVNKQVYLFDTFAGMTEPTDNDFSPHAKTPTRDTFDRMQRDGFSTWCYASLDDVKANFERTVSDMNGVHFVKGDVLKTLEQKSNYPKSIAILRLDTDWYESTKKELEVLYPLLSDKGVLLIDDYGYWDGARKAVEEYFANSQYPRPFLLYSDHTGRTGLKIQ